ncbi:hypothetical protein [Simplicispira psychrophila]|uniref:hypothetical protein n=1 Tax=Simplicispira psychrophila TaxID=80882 RepID=UPI001B800715|nr:hypothetical protein [Simplicispira psychrophila]
MAVISIAIVCDGTSDICIQDLIQAVADTAFPNQAFRITPAREVIPAHGSLHIRLERAYKDYEPDIIVCHRDAESTSVKDRTEEIKFAQEAAGINIPVIPAVPVRMIESWLLTDPGAIRCAADNRNGSVELNLPRHKSIEQLVDPKEILFFALKTASNLPTQRLKRFNEHRARSRIASFMDDFSGLRKLPSFQQFETLLTAAIFKQTEFKNTVNHI